MGLSWEDIAGALPEGDGAGAPLLAGRQAAVAIVLREGESGIEALFIRRADHPEDPWSGHMAFPGGRAEPGDESLLHTAVRETEEEIGVDLRRAGRLLGALPPGQAMARMRAVDMAITPFVFRLQERVDPQPSLEVQSVHWIPLDHLFEARTLSTLDHQHQGARYTFPCFRVGETDAPLVIWGLTYRMCTGLRDRIAAATAPPGPEDR